MSEAVPRPWELDGWELNDGKGNTIAHFATGWRDDQANAEFAAKAINNFDNALALLKQMLVLAENDGKLCKDSILADAIRKVVKEAE